jgi:tRNA U34 5-methylaminomethyl-2-thiouridine-forming methyltransferase MnmC
LATTANPVSLFEVGFGTGLNALLTLQQAVKLNRPTRYETIEMFPIDEFTQSELSDDHLFRKMHSAPWGQPTEIISGFVLYKRFNDLLLAPLARKFDVIYFDAFSPAVQPEMWSRDVFAKLYDAMNPGAILTTYCAKGEVRRTMQSVGLVVERLPGAAGKREMLRAWKK